MTYRIALFGVPGSGKTTSCSKIITKFLNNKIQLDNDLSKLNDSIKREYTIEQIAFTTYTKSGIESILKMININELPKQHYFKTLHKITWELCDYQQQNLIDEKELIEFFNKMHIPYSGKWGNRNIKIKADELPLGDHYLNLYEAYQNRTAKNIKNATDAEIIGLFYQINQEKSNLNAYEVNMLPMINSKFIEWKENNNKKMYSDSLMDVLTKKIDIPVKILIVDESQDTYPLQQQIIRMWTEQYDKDYLITAGDDDQGIHEWTGSDPSFLIDMAKNSDQIIIMEKSYRCPKIICGLANNIIQDVEERVSKRIYSEIEDGEYKTIITDNVREIIDKIDLNKETYMLFRTNKMKNEFADKLFKMTLIPFSFIDRETTSKYTLKFCNVNNALIKISNNLPISKLEATYLIDVIPTEKLKKGVRTLFKDKDEQLPDEFPLDYFFSEYTKFSFNSLLKDSLIDSMQYTRLGEKVSEKTLNDNELYKQKFEQSKDMVDYYFSANRTESKDKRARISFRLSLGTIHSSKGLGAEEIFLFLNTNDLTKINDSEKRLLYTGLTRTKKRCYGIYYGDMSESNTTLLRYMQEKNKIGGF